MNQRRDSTVAEKWHRDLKLGDRIVGTLDGAPRGSWVVTAVDRTAAGVVVTRRNSVTGAVDIDERDYWARALVLVDCLRCGDDG